MHHQNCQRVLTIFKGFRYLNVPAAVNNKSKFINHSSGSNRFISTTIPVMNKNVAVVLSGSGVYDGSEVHEAAACFAALTRHGAVPIAYSLDKTQHHAISHNTGEGLYLYWLLNIWKIPDI